MTKKKFNVFLDLDQTLISAEANDEFDFNNSKEKSKKFTSYDMDGYYIVFERPGLQDFLDYLFANFNVSIWTAASKDYAIFIIDKIILKNPKRKLDWIFFSYHCDISKKVKSGSKNLNMIWEEYGIEGYTKDNTVILDDYDEVYNTQPDNCIIAVPFEFSNSKSENDSYFNKLKIALNTMEENKPAKNINDKIKV